MDANRLARDIRERNRSDLADVDPLEMDARARLKPADVAEGSHDMNIVLRPSLTLRDDDQAPAAQRQGAQQHASEQQGLNARQGSGHVRPPHARFGVASL